MKIIEKFLTITHVLKLSKQILKHDKSFYQHIRLLLLLQIYNGLHYYKLDIKDELCGKKAKQNQISHAILNIFYMKNCSQIKVVAVI